MGLLAALLRLFALQAGDRTVPTPNDDGAACESCISIPFMAWCFTDQTCYASGEIGCDLSECASGSMMMPPCDLQRVKLTL